MDDPNKAIFQYLRNENNEDAARSVKGKANTDRSKNSEKKEIFNLGQF